MKKKKIALAMSGGVDSSVSAFLLKKKYKIIGIFMKNWKSKKNKCNFKKDFLDALNISNILNINLKIINFSEQYKKKIFKPFIKQYKKGNTPNPDIICNEKIKFFFFLNYCLIFLKVNLISTGHYAKIKKNKKKFLLIKSIDLIKDQTYFLYRINQLQLSKIIFPLNNLYKKQIRNIAEKNNFINFNKKNSTGICFINNKKFIFFLKKYIKYNYGPIKSLEKNIFIKNHIGLSFYTIGQRKGIKIGGNIFFKKIFKKYKPWYVAYKYIKKNILYITQNKYNPLLFYYKLIINKIHLINKNNNIKNILYVKVRSNQKEIPCLINKKKKKYVLYFIHPQWGISKGQSIVLYNNNICLGGGIIN